jgi:predicted RecA/RadA family phage recombinase
MSQAIFIHDGHTIDHIPTADVAAGAVVVQGSLVGVAKQPIKAGHLGSLAVVGVFDFQVEELESWIVGQPAYWNPGDGWAVTDSNNNTYKLLGKVVMVNSRPGSSHVRVRLSQ